MKREILCQTCAPGKGDRRIYGMVVKAVLYCDACNAQLIRGDTACAVSTFRENDPDHSGNWESEFVSRVGPIEPFATISSR
jgi:hypothetical protein